MNWRCPDCKAVEFVYTPKVITHGEGGEKGKGIYLCCDGCGALLFMQLRRSHQSARSDAWGIPKEKKR